MSFSPGCAEEACGVAVEVSAVEQPSQRPTSLQVLASLHYAMLDNNSPLHDQATFPVLALSNPTRVTHVECERVTSPFGSPSSSVPDCRPLDWPAGVVLGQPDLQDYANYAGCTNQEDDERGYDAGDSTVAMMVGNIRQDNDMDGYTGLGYADFSAALSGESLTFNLTECLPGIHTLSWRYSLSGSAWSDDDVKWMALAINGEQQPELHRFPPNEVWETWSTYNVRVTLRGGVNLIMLASAGWSGPKVDRLKVSDVVPEEPISRAWMLVAVAIFMCVVVPVLKLCISKVCGGGTNQSDRHGTGRGDEPKPPSPTSRGADLEDGRAQTPAPPSSVDRRYGLRTALEAHRAKQRDRLAVGTQQRQNPERGQGVVRFRRSELYAPAGGGGIAADGGDERAAVLRTRIREQKGRGRVSGVIAEEDRRAYFAEIGPAPRVMGEERVRVSEGPRGWGWRQIVLEPEPEPEPHAI